jgi:hypothetical protein
MEHRKKMMKLTGQKLTTLNTTSTFVRGTTTVNRQLNSSIINDRDALINQRDTQLLNPDSRLYR